MTRGRDIKPWIAFVLATGLVVAVALHEPMVIVFAFAGVGAVILVFALWLLRALVKSERGRR